MWADYLDVVSKTATIIIALVSLVLSYRAHALHRPKLKLFPVKFKCFISEVTAKEAMAFVVASVRNESLAEVSISHFYVEPLRPLRRLIKVLPVEFMMSLQLSKIVPFYGVVPCPETVVVMDNGLEIDYAVENPFSFNADISIAPWKTVTVSIVAKGECYSRLYQKKGRARFVLSCCYAGRTTRKTISMQLTPTMRLEGEKKA